MEFKCVHHFDLDLPVLQFVYWTNIWRLESFIIIKPKYFIDFQWEIGSLQFLQSKIERKPAKDAIKHIQSDAGLLEGVLYIDTMTACENPVFLKDRMLHLHRLQIQVRAQISQSHISLDNWESWLLSPLVHKPKSAVCSQFTSTSEVDGITAIYHLKQCK